MFVSLEIEASKENKKEPPEHTKPSLQAKKRPKNEAFWSLNRGPK